MYRTFVILRHTFVDTVVQPIYSLLLALGAVILTIFGLLPFFTLGEDTTMYKSVGLDVVMLLVLIATLFATSKSIFDEIEDRTMLTLMSKPVQKWEVLVGKYLGIALAALLAVFVLGIVIVLWTCYRIPNDYLLRATTLDDETLRRIYELRLMHTAGLLPCLVLLWLQICVLAAIGVALSTRFSLVVNLPTVILFYFAGNLMQFLFPLDAGTSVTHSAFAHVSSWLIPYLVIFDLRQPALYHDIALRGTSFAGNPNAVLLSSLWAYVAVAGGYGVAYITTALSAGMWLFQRRELGGSEG